MLIGVVAGTITVHFCFLSGQWHISSKQPGHWLHKRILDNTSIILILYVRRQAGVKVCRHTSSFHHVDTFVRLCTELCGGLLCFIKPHLGKWGWGTTIKKNGLIRGKGEAQQKESDFSRRQLIIILLCCQKVLCSCDRSDMRDLLYLYRQSKTLSPSPHVPVWWRTFLNESGWWMQRNKGQKSAGKVKIITINAD